MSQWAPSSSISRSIINLTTGNFFGETNRRLLLDGLTLTDTEYTHPRVDWHYHENAYFTFVLEGAVLEGNKKESYECGAGSLLYHYWQDPHYNVKPDIYTRGFHIELDPSWFDRMADAGMKGGVEGSMKLMHPSLKLLFYRMFKESCQVQGAGQDNAAGLSIQQLLVEAFGLMQGNSVASAPAAGLRNPPRWVGLVREMLHAEFCHPPSLVELAAAADIHPVHLSRDFRKYFHYTIGNYIRQLRVGYSLRLLTDRDLSLTSIAYTCGFADQPHFVRSFKESQGLSPSAYRRLLHPGC